MEFVADIKASFADKLGTIGGTFGIFLGVSFLGIFELFLEVTQLIKDWIYLKLKILSVMRTSQTKIITIKQ